MKKLHVDRGHFTVGSTLREALKGFWHPEITLAAQQVIAECTECQLMKSPHPALPDLKQIAPQPPLTRWAIDLTAVDSVPILVAIEYVTGWVEAEVMPNQQFGSTLPLLTRIVDIFGTPREWISDNAGCFAGEQALGWHKLENALSTVHFDSTPQGYSSCQVGRLHEKAGQCRQHLRLHPADRDYIAGPGGPHEASRVGKSVCYPPPHGQLRCQLCAMGVPSQNSRSDTCTTEAYVLSQAMFYLTLQHQSSHQTTVIHMSSISIATSFSSS
jgi:hypothetical protein